MTLFTVIAAVMVAVGLAWLLPPLLRARSVADVDRAGANLRILKDQLVELERDHAGGSIGAEQYAETRTELERRVLEEVQVDEARTRRGGPVARAPRALAWVLAACLPIVATLLYVRWGDPQAFDPLIVHSGEDMQHALKPEQIDQLVTALEARLAREPDNADGWSTLARTHYSQGRFSEAARAYARLVELVPDVAAVLADYADALAMAQGRNIEGKPLELVNRALKLEPTQWKALAMAGTAAFNRKDYAGAVEYWERLRGTLPPDAPITQQIGASIAEARSLAELPAAPPAAAPPVAAAQKAVPPTPPAADPPAATAGTVTGTVDLGAAVKAKASPTDTVYIFARPAEGPRMPLAIVQVKVADLPAKFALDDSMAMSPNFRLSAFTEVVVGARVSKSGQAMPRSGDLEGLSKPVKVGSRDIAVTINNVLP
jgi:cytochrome c-type biogenesis protein CcmH